MIAIDVLAAAHAERQARLHAEADARRLARHLPGRPLRRVVGHAIVRAGERLADEPAPDGLSLAPGPLRRGRGRSPSTETP